MRASGLSEEEILIEKEQKARAIRRSQLTTLHSQQPRIPCWSWLGTERIGFVCCHSSFPHLQLLAPEQIEQKFAALATPQALIKLLFVGRESKRKGLPIVLEAFQALDAPLPRSSWNLKSSRTSRMVRSKCH